MKEEQSVNSFFFKLAEIKIDSLNEGLIIKKKF